MRILLLGKNGQIGWELQRALAPLGELTAYGSDRFDLANLDGLRDVVRAAGPDVIVNAAAHTAVDQAETESELTHTLNARAPGVIAEEARRQGALMVHYSTDYVFDGQKQTAYVEDDPVNPLNVYGHSKRAGECAIAASGCRYLVLRTSWVYSARSSNFFLTIRRLASELNELRVVADQHGVPNWSRTLGEATAALLATGLRREWPTGTYHLSSRGQTTWHGFAQAILEELRIDKPVVPIRTDQFSRPAKRPPNAILDSGKLERDFGILLPDWRQSLGLCVADFLAGRQGG
uniref:dTDP-4-dehydrorhamnose reductase n=1 Tax=uncultured bacterium CSL142 TaxID=1091569 RepID=G4WVM3_9BACT|nr:dTDP-4-dehydrorhamnose reductase [uncultured bacterium CSL142]